MFDVKKHLIKVQGNRQYLPVSARLVWFREEHPDWGIETKAIVIDTEKQFAIFEATVYDSNGKLMAKGTKMEDVRGFHDYVEKSETGAIGRALAVCGFGTQFAPDLDEMDGNRYVDTPQSIRNADSFASDRPSEPARPTPSAVGFRPSQTLSPYEGGASRRENGAQPTYEALAPRADANRTGPSVSPAVTADNGHVCTACGCDLKIGQEALSLRKYGIALCPVCQKERSAAEAAG